MFFVLILRDQSPFCVFLHTFWYFSCCLGLVHLGNFWPLTLLPLWKELFKSLIYLGRQFKKKKTYTSCKKNKFTISVFAHYWKVWEAILFEFEEKIFHIKICVHVRRLCGLMWLSSIIGRNLTLYLKFSVYVCV